MNFKKKSIFFVLFAALFFAQISFAQDGHIGQKMSISQGPVLHGIYDASGNPAGTGYPSPLPITNPFPLTFKSLDGTPPTVGNIPCEGVTNGFCGWYEAFWIFGDGNYRNHVAGNTIESDTATLTVQHLYAQTGSYKPVVYLTEKYHNTKPPEAARAVINVSGGGASGNYVELTKRLQGRADRKVDMDFNHFPRVDYPMNFAISYRKNEPAVGLIYYYNSLASNTFDSFTPTWLFNYAGNEATHYQGADFRPQVEGEDIEMDFERPSGEYRDWAGSTILDGLSAKFKSRLLYDLSNLEGPFPDGMTELRVFPVLQTRQLSDMPDGLMTDTPTTRFPCFATILIGTSPVKDSDPAYARLMANAQILLDTTGELRLNPNSQLYITGIEIMNLRMQTSHDPNSLVVTNVEDIGNGDFKVTFKLTICNEGIMPESSPTLFFNDLTSGKYGTKPELVDIADSIARWSASAPWSVNLNGYIIPGVPESHAPSCRELIFTMITDAAGVDKLYQKNPRALEVCVNFSAGVGECSKNEVLSKDTPPIPDCNGLLLWLLIAILAAILLWYLLKGRTM